MILSKKVTMTTFTVLTRKRSCKSMCLCKVTEKNVFPTWRKKESKHQWVCWDIRVNKMGFQSYTGLLSSLSRHGRGRRAATIFLVRSVNHSLCKLESLCSTREENYRLPQDFSEAPFAIKFIQRHCWRLLWPRGNLRCSVLITAVVRGEGRWGRWARWARWGNGKEHSEQIVGGWQVGAWMDTCLTGPRVTRYGMLNAWEGWWKVVRGDRV